VYEKIVIENMKERKDGNQVFYTNIDLKDALRSNAKLAIANLCQRER